MSTDRDGQFDNVVDGHQQRRPLWVHLDLKGAPTKIDFLHQLLPIFTRNRVFGIMIEYEDMFPYVDELSVIASAGAYSRSQLNVFIDECIQHNIAIIPLVQTFGHMEFVLKHSAFAHLREHLDHANALCPSHPESIRLVHMMLDQVMSFHHMCDTVHIGCDEVYPLGQCQKCQHRMIDHVWTNNDLFIDHVKAVSMLASNRHQWPKVLIWDDMLRSCTVPALQLIAEFVQPVVWFYETHSFPDVIGNYAQAFMTTLWAASAFKGASGPTAILPDIGKHVENQRLWLAVIADHRQRTNVQWGGMVLTGWSRYDHYAVLCELLPTALSSLLMCLHIHNCGIFDERVHAEASINVGLTVGNLLPFSLRECAFDGSWQSQLPGHNVCLIAIRLVHLRDEFCRLMISDVYRAWFSAQNVRNGRLSKPMLNQLMSKLQLLIIDFDQFESVAVDQLSIIYDANIVDEYLHTYFRPYANKLIKLEQKLNNALINTT